MKYKIGIDPGVANLGLAVLDENNDLVLVERVVPKIFSSIPEAVDHIQGLIKPYIENVESAAIEKYVVYGKGVPSTSMIDTITLIGALQYMFHINGIETPLYRAIDWKTSVCKHLFKEEGFRNPSDKLDKKFSMAASLHICKKEVGTDHEADAVCVAFNSWLKKEKR